MNRERAQILEEVNSLEDIFSLKEGIIARNFKSYEFRPQQLQMAKAVEKAIFLKRHLIVEAGTGIGKSLAYLIPFIRWAISNGKKVVISTYTKTLQEQLVKKDLPFLKEALGFNFRFSLCLGGENYLCLRRFKQNLNFSLFESKKEERQISRINKWFKNTETGLRSDLEVRIDDSVWDKVCRESDLCLGKKCLYRNDCFYNKARLKQFKSHILVTNHHLYFANLISGGRVLPSFDALVFDEAHTLENVATNYLGIEVSNFKIRNFLDSIFNPHSEKGFLSRVRNLDKRRTEAIKKKLEEARIASQSFFLALISKYGQDTKSLRLKRRNFIFNYLKEPFLGLISLLEDLLDDIDDEENKIEVESFILRAKNLIFDLETVINMGLEGYVYWVEILNRPKRPKYSLLAAPIDISQEFKKKVLDKVKPIIFTSATLSTCGDFEFIKRSLGIEDADELLLDSPFNYTKNAVLYLPGNLTDPSREFNAYQKEAIGEIKKILSIFKGRTFILFTSFKMMDASYKILKEDFKDLNILRQGDFPRYRLLEIFKSTSNSVLLGTNTFWQGVDVPGRALECVIISKLPFAVPDEPIIEAKMELLSSQNKNPFIHYQIPQAIIMLRQGFGRLIRTKQDKGLVVILDPRIKTRFYGKDFLEALPNCQQILNLAQAKKIFSLGD